MKRIIITCLLAIAIISSFAQAPQAFKYQAVARDSTGELITNQLIGVQVSILEGSASGMAVYTETFQPTTNQFGLVSLEIGTGTIESGVFGDISWATSSHFLKIELDETGNTNYQLIGTSQLLSVPYSLNSSSLTITSPDGTAYEVTVDDSGNLSTIISCLPLTDIDGNTYITVLIGGQCWMKENLKTTTYRNGAPIPNVTSNSAWSNLTTGAYAWYDNDINWKDSYGALYNWYTTVDANGLCPTGWHVPTNDERTALTDFIGGTGSPHGNELKSCRQINSPLGGACNTTEHPRWYDEYSSGEFGTDDYGFSGLPGGYRYHTVGSFESIGDQAGWWYSSEYSSSDAWYSKLYASYGFVGLNSNDKQFGFSVRCLQNNKTNQVPIQPSTPNPADGSTDIGLYTHLSWSCSDPDGDYLAYNVYFGTNPAPPLAAESLSDTTYNPGFLDPATTYYWKVVAIDIYGDSTSGIEWSFTTEVNLPPYAPSNPIPADGSTDVVDPNLLWSCSDPNGDDLIYSIYFGTNADPPFVAGSLSDTTFNPGALNLNTTYYWKITAIDSHDDSTTSSIWSFTTEVNLPPNAPSNPIPADGSTDVADPNLLWSCSDPNGDDLIYSIYFGTNADPPFVADSISDTTFNSGALNLNTTYYWKITAIDIHDDSTASSIWSFTTDAASVCGNILLDDRDGKEYNTVQIGTQCWMAENLNLGTRINGSVDQSQNTPDEIFEKYCYNNVEDSCDVYGGLYQWNEMMQYVSVEGVQGICPAGWHIPTDAEWCTLENFADQGSISCTSTGYRGIDAGLNLKSTFGWDSGGNGSDLYGFTGLPGGSRLTDTTFSSLTIRGIWWSSTESIPNPTDSWDRIFRYDSSSIDRSGRYDANKDLGFSVRCLKD